MLSNRLILIRKTVVDRPTIETTSNGITLPNELSNTITDSDNHTLLTATKRSGLKKHRKHFNALPGNPYLLIIILNFLGDSAPPRSLGKGHSICGSLHNYDMNNKTKTGLFTNLGHRPLTNRLYHNSKRHNAD